MMMLTEETVNGVPSGERRETARRAPFTGSRVGALVLQILARVLKNKELSHDAGAVRRGQKTLVGPGRPVVTEDGQVVRAGVFSERLLSERMNLEVDGEELDRAFALNSGRRRSAAVLVRGIWALVLDGIVAQAAQDHFDLLGVVVNNGNTEGILRTIEDLLEVHPNALAALAGNAQGRRAVPDHVCFVNAHNLNVAAQHSEYGAALRAAQLVLPDGIGVKLALRMAGGALRRNLNGTDLFPHLAERFAATGRSIFLLGATDEVLARAASQVGNRFPELDVAGVRNGYFTEAEEAAVCAEINASGAAVLVIGMGTPRQELFVARNAQRLNVSLVLSMGGLLDFLGEKNRRAPLWMRQAGLEWIFRMIEEPGRMWRRYLVGNPVFLWRVRRWLKEKAKATSQGAAPR